MRCSVYCHSVGRGISIKCSDRRKSYKRNRKYGPIILNVTNFYLLVQLIQICFLGGFILMLLTPNALKMCNIMLRLKTENKRNISHLILIQIYQQLGSTSSVKSKQTNIERHMKNQIFRNLTAVIAWALLQKWGKTINNLSYKKHSTIH